MLLFFLRCFLPPTSQETSEGLWRLVWAESKFLNKHLFFIDETYSHPLDTCFRLHFALAALRVHPVRFSWFQYELALQVVFSSFLYLCPLDRSVSAPLPDMRWHFNGRVDTEVDQIASFLVHSFIPVPETETGSGFLPDARFPNAILRYQSLCLILILPF